MQRVTFEKSIELYMDEVNNTIIKNMRKYVLKKGFDESSLSDEFTDVKKIVNTYIVTRKNTKNTVNKKLESKMYKIKLMTLQSSHKDVEETIKRLTDLVYYFSRVRHPIPS
jgi:heterodisulfide reductase subunit C